MNKNIIEFNFNGNTIPFIEKDDSLIINVTEMAKYFPGKKISHFLSNQQTENLINNISNTIKIPSAKILTVIKGNYSSGIKQGTSMNEYLSISFSKWLGNSAYISLINFLKEYYLGNSKERIINYDKEELEDFIYDLLDSLVNKDILLNYKNTIYNSTLELSNENEKLVFNIPLENYSINLTKEDILIISNNINPKYTLKTISYLDKFIEKRDYSYINLKYLILSNVLELLLNDKNNYSSNNQKTYLMKDSNTGYTKIGKAVNPRFREKTLQSEKPTISLYAVCDNLIELELHNKYSDKRVRGEWFNLEGSDVKEILDNYKFNIV